MWTKLKSPHALFNSQETNRTYDSAGKFQGSWKTKINVLFSLVFVKGKVNYLFQNLLWKSLLNNLLTWSKGLFTIAGDGNLINVVVHLLFHFNGLLKHFHVSTGFIRFRF